MITDEDSWYLLYCYRKIFKKRLSKWSKKKIKLKAKDPHEATVEAIKEFVKIKKELEKVKNVVGLKLLYITH
jgi:hypothetical protein